MRYNIIGKNIDVWDKTKEMVEKKMDRIAKLFPADTEATITLSLEKQVATVEVTIPMNKRYARAEVQDADMTAAMDKTVDILEGQVVRCKKTDAAQNQKRRRCLCGRICGNSGA